MRHDDCEAVILTAGDYREADRLVTLFSLEHGKLRGIARGAKRSVRRFGGALEPFARLRLQLRLTDGLCPLAGADIVSVYPGVRGDLSRIAMASYACELVDRLLPEGIENPRLYRLLVACLEHLEDHPYATSDRRFFEINLLNILGYRPPLDQCAACGAELDAAPKSRFRVLSGGIFCDGCGTGRTISGETLHLFRLCLATGRFGRVRFGVAGLVEAGEFLDAAVASHLVRPLKSLPILRELAESA